MSAAPSTTGRVLTLSSVADHASLRQSAQQSQSLLVLLFTSGWHPPCKQMRAVCDQLAIQFPQVQFAEVSVEEENSESESGGLLAASAFAVHPC